MMTMEERLHQCYSTNSAWRTSSNKMNKKQNMQITNNIKKSWDVEENIDAAITCQLEKKMMMK